MRISDDINRIKARHEEIKGRADSGMIEKDEYDAAMAEIGALREGWGSWMWGVGMFVTECFSFF